MIQFLFVLTDYLLSFILFYLLFLLSFILFFLVVCNIMFCHATFCFVTFNLCLGPLNEGNLSVLLSLLKLTNTTTKVELSVSCPNSLLILDCLWNINFHL